ncbi:TetR/AcrR family transcriptional regulator C-terminal domain-containing protein [Actinomadura sp. NPDC048394]|jgi:AcrR family transcriptional regulator|uniref:TetR/AcrR family transcriptional regulator n=1 Tax=Actinomadura sp. NPDC048394 TaxID=3158223 RepID=UPI0033ED5C88
MPKPAPQRVMRVVLTRELIVHTSVDLIERKGPEALSMRAVGAELGVTAMAMYKHVPNKDALVEGIAEYVMDTMDLPEAPPGDWRSGARELVRAFRRTANEYPRSMALVVASKTGIPVGLRAIERALGLCDEAGLDGKTSVHVMRSLMAYALGSQLREAGQSKLMREPSGDLADDLQDSDAGACLPGEDHPGELSEHGTDADFEFGLELFLSSIEHMGSPAN